MRIGIHLPSFSSDHSRLVPSRLKRYVKTAESIGFSSAWVGEHLVKPPSYNTDWLSPLTTLSVLAGEVSVLDIGTSVLLLPLRNPVFVAKQALTLQYLSEGRFKLGVGLGYAQPDFEAAGVPYEERSARFTEAIELLNLLLHENNITFEGDFYSVEDLTIEPRVSRPPPVILGGGGIERDGERFVPAAIKERLRYADGWIASTSSTPSQAASDWSDLSDYLERHDEAPETYETIVGTQLHVVENASRDVALEQQRQVFGRHVSDERGLDFAEERYTFGSIAEIQDDLHTYKTHGFDELILMPVADGTRGRERQLELIGKHVIGNI